MDTNSIYENYGLTEKNSKSVKKFFYTEIVKDTDEQNTVIKKVKKILMKKLL